MPLIDMLAAGEWDYEQNIADARTVYIALSAVAPVLLLWVLDYFRREASGWIEVKSLPVLALWGVGYLVALGFAVSAAVFAVAGASYAASSFPAVQFILQGCAVASSIVILFSAAQTFALLKRAVESAMAFRRGSSTAANMAHEGAVRPPSGES